MKKRTLSLLLAAMMCLSITGCQTSTKGGTDESKGSSADSGDAWPQKTINIICPFGAGGDTDYNARLFAEKLSDELGVACVVTNVTGNGGATGAQQVHDAANDGYNVLFYHEALYVNNVTGATDFSNDDFEMSCIVGKSAGSMICVAGDSEYQTLDDLIEKSKNSNVTFASNVGATTHVMGAMLNRAAGGTFNLVDMGGTSDRVAALLGHQCDAIPSAVGSSLQYIENGDFRPLCIMEEERNELFPDVPTAKELGYDISFPIHYFVAFPKGTDPDIVEKMADACEKIAAREDVQAAQYESYAQSPFFMRGDEMMDLEAKSRKTVEDLDELLNS